MFATGIFPDDFKVGQVIPIPKTLAPKELGEFRPITLLNLFSKVFEKVLVRSCANESQNQSNCLLSSHVIIQLIFNTAKQRYIYSKQTKKSENKDTVIKFLLSCNIRSLCNTAHCSERYVPTTGHRRQNTRINILINGSATTDLPPRKMGMMDDKASRGCPAYTSVGEKKSGAEHQQ